MPRPVVSVIIATYNWSSVLECAIASVLLQTHKDFELLVIGDGCANDGCADDSETVVRSFADPRITWVNLESNSGNQVVPNNHGLSLAQGEYIAYLGHDDIWYPTHLQSLVAKIEENRADIAGAVTILYGPPESGVRGVSGILENHQFMPDDFMVPSSILHRRSLIDKIGPWRDAAEIASPTDCELLKRAYDSGAAIVSTNEVTVFKFNAAWRKGAYRTRTASEQREMLERIRTGEDFRQKELIDVIRSIFEGKSVRIKAPNPADFQPGAISKTNARIKGASSLEIRRLARLVEPIRFDLTDQAAVFDWYGLEPCPSGTFRWSGPSALSHLEFPIFIEEPFHVRVEVLGHFQDDLSADVQMQINSEPVSHTLHEQGDGRFLLSALAPESARVDPARPVTVSLRVRKTVRPIDLGMNTDTRRLGIAVAGVEFHDSTPG